MSVPSPKPAPEKDAQALLARLRREGVLRSASSVGMDHGRGLFPTGVEPLDRALGGGLPRGRIAEVVGRVSSGRTAFLFLVLASAPSRGEQAALIDPEDGFDPAAAALAGVRLERGLWIRPSRSLDAFRAADLVLDVGGFGVVAIDLLRPGRDARRAQPPWPRLSLRAERAGSVLLVSGERPEVGTFAATVLGLRRDAAGWVGGGPSPLLLERLDVRIDVLRSKVGGAAGPVRWASSSARGRSTDAA